MSLKIRNSPRGHTLALGDSRRFGNLLVTAQAITKAPIEFVHHLGDPTQTTPPGPEVLKLWLKFENVSTNQSIAPLDALVFRRHSVDRGETYRSNNFVCPDADRENAEKRVLVWDLNENDRWNLKDQEVSYEIPPGESVVTYIPTTEEGSSLASAEESLVWRVHFRKGYSPKMYGVTTVIEVPFTAAEIGPVDPNTTESEENPVETKA